MIKYFAKYTGEYKKYVFFIPIAVFLEISCELLIPLLMSDIVDIGIDALQLQYILNVGLIMIILVMLAILFGCILMKCATLAGQGIAYNIRTELYRKIQQFSLSGSTQFSSSTLTSIITDDVETLQNSFVSLYVLIRAPFMLICAFILAVIMDATLAIIISITLPVIALLLCAFIQRAYRFYRIIREKLYILTRSLPEALTRAKNTSESEKDKLKKAEQEINSAEAKAAGQSMLFMPILMFIINAATIAILWYGGNMVSESTLGTGKLIGFISYMLQIFICITQIYFVLSLVMKSKASSKRIKEVICASADLPGSQALSGQSYEIPEPNLTKNHLNSLHSRKNCPSGYARPKSTKKAVSRLFQFFDHGIPYLIIIGLMILITTASELEGSYYLKPLINDYIIPGNLKGFAGALVILGLIYIAGGLASYGQTRLMSRITQKATIKIREKLVYKLQTFPENDVRTTNDILECCTNEVDNLQSTLEQNATQLISNIVSFLGILIMMIILSPALFSIILLIIVFMVLLTSKIGRKSWEHFLSQQKSRHRLNQYIGQTIEGLKNIKYYNAKDEFEKLNKTYLLSSVKADFYSGIVLPIMGNLNNMCYAAASLFGGLLSVLSRFDIGSLASFLQYSRQIGQPVEQMTSQINNLLSAMAGAERIFDLIDKG